MSNKENLKNLFEGFLKPQEAAQAQKDIQLGEQLFRDNPAPEPDKVVIRKVKAEIVKALDANKSKIFKRTVYRTAAVAAMFLLAGVVSVKLFEKTNYEPAATDIAAKAIWENDDTDLAEFAAEIEQIKNNVLAMELYGYSTNGITDISELEAKLNEVNTDFWEG